LDAVDILGETFVPNAVDITVGNEAAEIGMAGFMGRGPTRYSRGKDREAVAFNPVKIGRVHDVIAIVGKLSEAVFVEGDGIAGHFGVVLGAGLVFRQLPCAEFAAAVLGLVRLDIGSGDHLVEANCDGVFIENALSISVDLFRSEIAVT
jgi:hypothetical protein